MKNIVFCLVTLLLSSCNTRFSTREVSHHSLLPADGDKMTISNRIKSIRYFRGGYYAPGSKGWSYDFQVVFTSAGANLIGRNDDMYCFSHGEIDQNETTLLLAMIQSLKVVRVTNDALLIDAGVEIIEITNLDQSVQRIHLNELETLRGEHLATNGYELSNALKQVATKIFTACE